MGLEPILSNDPKVLDDARKRSEIRSASLALSLSTERGRVAIATRGLNNAALTNAGLALAAWFYGAGWFWAFVLNSLAALSYSKFINRRIEEDEAAEAVSDDGEAQE